MNRKNNRDNGRRRCREPTSTRAGKVLYTFLFMSAAAAQPSSSYTWVAGIVTQKRQKNTRARDVGCRDNLAEESALSTTSKTIDSRTDHMIVSESVYYSRSFVDPEDALETVMMMFRFLFKDISILLRLCCKWGYPSRKHATRKTQPLIHNTPAQCFKMQCLRNGSSMCFERQKQYPIPCPPCAGSVDKGQNSMATHHGCR